MMVTLAVDAGGSFLKSALVSKENGVLGDTLFSCPADSEGGAGDVREGYRTVLRAQMRMAAERRLDVARVCVDTPGPFDYRAGCSLMTHKYRAVYGVPLRPWIREIAGEIPVLFLHDSTAFLLGEAGDLPECRSAAGVMLGTGLGFALMEGGRVLLLSSGGPLVSIYHAPYRGGTAEDYVSARGIVSRYNRRSKTPAANAKEIADRIPSGDRAARETYEETGAMLAEILYPVLKERKTEVLTIGGQIARSFDVFGSPLREGLRDLDTLAVVRGSERIDIGHLLGAGLYDETAV